MNTSYRLQDYRGRWVELAAAEIRRQPFRLGSLSRTGSNNSLFNWN